MVVGCQDFELVVKNHKLFVCTRLQYFKLDALPNNLDKLVNNVMPNMWLSDFRDLFYEHDEWGNPTKQLVKMVSVGYNPKH